MSWDRHHIVVDSVEVAAANVKPDLWRWPFAQRAGCSWWRSLRPTLVKGLERIVSLGRQRSCARLNVYHVNTISVAAIHLLYHV